MQGLQQAIRTNRLKTWALVFLFPVVLGFAIFCLAYGISIRSVSSAGMQLSRAERVDVACGMTLSVLQYLVPLLIIWLLISFYFQRQIAFSFSGAKPVSRKEEPEIYNIVENLTIAKGLPMSRVGVIETDAMNAFAVGRRPSNSWIVFTRGLLNTLQKSEIEAVAAHELTHIINKDSLLMFVMVVYIGAISFFGEMFIRTSSSSSHSNSDDSKSRNLLPLLGIVLMLLGYLFYPLMRLAISRKREYLADAGSVMITHDASSMISALKKISSSSEVALLKNQQMAAAFIVNPLGKIKNLFQTHPSLEDRIQALESYL